jgi:hypothetical protein
MGRKRRVGAMLPIPGVMTAATPCPAGFDRGAAE